MGERIETMSAAANPSSPTHSLSVGDDIELEVTGIAHGGVCVARHNGRVVFVADAIPGERVIARVTYAKKKSFARATTTQVLEPSPHRVPHIWPEAALERDIEQRAGGAEFGHISLSHQRALKAQVLADSLVRFGGLTSEQVDQLAGGTLSVEPAPGDDERNGLGYRTRVHLHVDPDTGAVGPYATRSRRVIEATSLPLANEQIGFIAPLDERLVGVEAVELIAPSADDPRMLITEPGSNTRAGENDRVAESVGGREFLVRAGGFWQVHREAPLVLFEAVRDAVIKLIEAGRFEASATHLDLYGGAGLLAAAMAEAAGPTLKVTTVEADPQATDDAAENLAELVGALAITGRVDHYLRDLLAAPVTVRDRLRDATVVLDPPRSGAGGEVIASLCQLAPANIIYVACDPVALARDTKSLIDGGYQPVSLRAFDLFAHTHHLAAMMVFVRSS